MANEFPEIVYRYPISTNGAIDDLRPSIVLDWSVDIDTAQFIDDATRAQLVIVIDPTTQTIINTDYVSYTAGDRRLTLQVSSDLDRNKTYKIFVRNRVLASSGRRSVAEYEWEFTTALSVIGSVSLLDPANKSIQSIFPTLSWLASSATGTVFYRVQIDDRFDFNTPDYDEVTVSTSLLPYGSFASSQTWYWRILPFTTTASGAWSDTRSFFYGTVAQADQTTSVTWGDNDVFGASQPKWHMKSHQAAFPTLTLSFTSTPATSFESYVSVWKKDVLPRNDDLDSYDYIEVAGSWSQSGDTLTFTPSEDIDNNTKYEIRIDSNLTNTSNQSLGEDYVYWFTSKYTPYYVDIRVIRSKLMSAELQIPDDYINFIIHQVSLEANARYYGYIASTSYYSMYGDTLKENIVRDSKNLNSFGVLKWVAACTVFNLLRSIQIDMLRSIDLSRKLGDYQETLGPGVIKAIEQAMQIAQGEIEEWENYLIPSDIPLSVSRSAGWSPMAWDYDLSITDVSKRDDLWS